jgi:hypothetical protein
VLRLFLFTALVAAAEVVQCNLLMPVSVSVPAIVLCVIGLVAVAAVAARDGLNVGVLHPAEAIPL